MKGPDNISEIYKALSEAAKSKGSTLKMDEATFRTKFSEDEGFRGYVQTKLSDKFKTVDELNEYAGFKKKKYRPRTIRLGIWTITVRSPITIQRTN